jgi:hypothetical protein
MISQHLHIGYVTARRNDLIAAAQAARLAREARACRRRQTKARPTRTQVRTARRRPSDPSRGGNPRQSCLR